MDVAGKVVVVTGASSGFGRLTALELASRGWRTFGAFRGTASGFDAASAELRDAAGADAANIETVRIDVTDDASVTDGILSIHERAGRIDALVNVAGYGVHGPWPTIGVADFKAQLETNLVGMYRMCLAVEPIMRSQGAGWIVNVSSDAAIRASFWEVAYAASKYGVEGMSLGMRLESAHVGIRVSVVEPGWYKDTNYEAAMVSTVDWDEPTGPYAELVRVMVENQGKVEWGKPGAEQVGQRVAELLEMDDPPFRNPVEASPVRRDDVPVEDYERELFEFYSMQAFRGPWLSTPARR
jgi:NAD(P)-dependent dehydrogenase (short-subunit alcohol dehydrogenase family)